MNFYYKLGPWSTRVSSQKKGPEYGVWFNIDIYLSELECVFVLNHALNLTKFGNIGLDMLVKEIDKLLLPDGAGWRLDVVLDQDFANLVHLDGPRVKVRVKVVWHFIYWWCHVEVVAAFFGDWASVE